MTNCKLHSFIRGLASIPASHDNGIGLPGCPYLDGRADWNHMLRNSEHKSSSFSDAVRYHLLCERVPGNTSSNPYVSTKSPSDSLFPFHITFYERVERAVSDLSQWKVGELFEDGSNSGKFSRHFRRSAFTVVLHIFTTTVTDFWSGYHYISTFILLQRLQLQQAHYRARTGQLLHNPSSSPRRLRTR
jgi:hypothetical protein